MSLWQTLQVADSKLHVLSQSRARDTPRDLTAGLVHGKKSESAATLSFACCCCQIEGGWRGRKVMMDNRLTGLCSTSWLGTEVYAT